MSRRHRTPVIRSVLLLPDGRTVRVEYDQALFLASGDAKDGWSATVDAAPATIESALVSGRSVYLLLESEVTSTQELELAYDASQGGLVGGAKTADDEDAVAVPNASTITVIACAYPLSALLAEIQAVFGGSATRLTLTNDDQTGSYTIAGSLGSGSNALALPADFATTPATLDYTAGIKGIEFAVTAPAMTGGTGDPAYEITFGLNTSDLSGNIFTTTLSADDNGGFAVEITSDESETPIYSATGLTVAPSLFSLTLNATAGALALEIDGAPVVLGVDTLTPAEAVVSMRVQESAGVPAANAGEIVSITVRTNAGDMTGGFTAGATDACGNTIG